MLIFYKGYNQYILIINLQQKWIILIACHCKAQHPPVYITDSITNPKAKYYSLYDEKMLPEIKQQFGINKIDYIDKKC